MFKQLIRQILNSHTSEHQAKLIKHLSETEIMTKAARATHEVVQKVSSHVDQFSKGGPVKLPKSTDATNKSTTPLHHEELTDADHAAARRGGRDLLSALRRAKEQVKSDAAADWNDIKSKFTRK